MSYYEEIKAIRLPIEINEDAYDNKHKAYDDIYEKVNDISNRLQKNGILNTSYFCITNVCEGFTYLDLVYYNSEGGAEFQISNYLTDEEFELVKSLFSEIVCGFLVSDFRKVHYCYYNGCDPSDCYKIESQILTIEDIYG